MLKATQSTEKLQEIVDEMGNPAVKMHRHIANLLQIGNDLGVMKRNLVKADLAGQAKKVAGL